ncbi:MAG: replication initiator protein A [Lachnospiraceae bacterium]|nr:replication initiator protein A [Lachnospiraceae bacterium]
MKLEYFIGTEADDNAFVKLPKIIFKDKNFKGLGSAGRLLYSLMLDRMQLSYKNNWLDDDGKVYIYYTAESIMEDIEIGRNKTFELLSIMEEKYGLIERRKQGQGKPTRIYVKRIISEQEDTEVSEEAEKISIEIHGDTAPVSEVPILNFKNTENRDSRSTENNILEVCKPNANKTDINKNNYSNTKSNLIKSDDEKDYEAEAAAYRRLVRDNLCIDSLLERHPFEAEIIEGMCDIIVETVISRKSSIWVSRDEYPAAVVKSKLLKLCDTHIEYALECLNENKSEIRNIKSYLLTTLFNAPSTMECHDQAKANHDMAECRV